MTYVPLNTHVMLSICLCIFYLDTGTSRDMCPCTQKIQNVMIGIIDLEEKGLQVNFMLDFQEPGKEQKVKQNGRDIPWFLRDSLSSFKESNPLR